MQHASLLRPSMIGVNVTNANDVDLPSKQLSKSIDVVHYDSPTTRRQPPTFMAAFPCEKCINAVNRYPTFPLIFRPETRRKFDEYQNISSNNLCGDLEKRLRPCERGRNINNIKHSKLTKKNDEENPNLSSLYYFDSKKTFPFVNQMVRNTKNLIRFPCYIEDMKDKAKVKNSRFPLKVGMKQETFPCRHQIFEEADNINLVMKQIKRAYFLVKKFEEILKVFRKLKTTENDFKGLKYFPLNKASTFSRGTKFPCILTADVDVKLSKMKNFEKVEVFKLHPADRNFETETMLRNAETPVIINLGFSKITDGPINRHYMKRSKFPLKSKGSKCNIRCFPHITSSYNCDTGIVEKSKSFQHLKVISLKDNLKSLRKPFNSSSSHHTLINFPLKSHESQKELRKFPQTTVDNLNQTGLTEKKITIFPRNRKEYKAAIKQFPLDFNSESGIFKSGTFYKFKVKLDELKTLGNIQKQMELRFRKSSNKATMYSNPRCFPLNKSLLKKKIRKFPCTDAENSDNVEAPIKLISSSCCKLGPHFPAKLKSNSTKFPVAFRVKELQNIKSKGDLLSHTKILKPLQKFSSFRIPPPAIFKVFPLKTNYINLNNKNFPIQHDNLFKSPSIIKKFPVTLKTSTNKFPHGYSNTAPEFERDLSLYEIHLKYQLNKIPYSLQVILETELDAQNPNSMTKFPLNERLVKKFYRKFPQAMGISKLPYTQHDWTTVKNVISINLEKYKAKISENSLNAKQTTGVNILRTTTAITNDPNNLQKQQWLYCQKANDVNEQYALQVQFAAQQVHVEKLATATGITSSTSTSPEKRNDDLTILPARNIQNMSISTTTVTTTTTTPSSSELGQNSENFQHSPLDAAIINIVDEEQQQISSSTVLSAKHIKHALLNHQAYDDDADDEDEKETEREQELYECALLRASTPTMSTTTSVQNAERIRAAHQQQLLFADDHDHDLGDLCNPQVAQIVEHSDVRDTFIIAVDNDGEIIGNSSSTGCFLAKNVSPPLPFLSPTLHSAALSNNTTEYKCRTSLENCPCCGELLPKYSVLELCEFCGNVVCHPTEIDESKTGVTTSQNYPSIECSHIAYVRTPETEIENKCLPPRETATTSDLIDTGENKVNEILLHIHQTDEMKLEMRSAKGALSPSGGATSSPTSGGRTVGKYNDTAATTSYPRFKDSETTKSLKNTNDRLYLSNSRTTDGTTPRRLSHDSTGSASSLSGRSTPISRYHNDSPQPNNTRRLSGDNAMSTKSISGHSTPTLRYANDSSTLISNRLSTSQRYTNDSNALLATAAMPMTNRFSTSQRYGNETPTTAHAMPSITNRNSTPSLGSLRNTNSTSMLSVDMPRYTPSTRETLADCSAAPVNRAISLDAPTLDILPERTRLRRQRRLRPQESLGEEEEDAVQRLNRLKARITASLSEVKSVLKQYSADGEAENDNQMSNTLVPPPPVPSNSTLKAEEQQEGPVNFRFVKKIRRRSFLKDDNEEDNQTKTADQDETDKSVTGKTSEQSLHEMSPSKPLPQETKQFQNKIENNTPHGNGNIKAQEKENKVEVHVVNVERKSAISNKDTVLPIIKVDEHDKVKKDLKNNEHKIETELNKNNENKEVFSKSNEYNLETKSEVFENNNKSVVKPNDNKSENTENIESKFPQKSENELQNQNNESNDENLKKRQQTEKSKFNRSPSKSPQKIRAKETTINDICKSPNENEIATSQIRTTKEISLLDISTNVEKAEGKENDLKIEDISKKTMMESQINKKDVSSQPHAKPENKDKSTKPFNVTENLAADIPTELHKTQTKETEVNEVPLKTPMDVNKEMLRKPPTPPTTKNLNTNVEVKEILPKTSATTTKDDQATKIPIVVGTSQPSPTLAKIDDSLVSNNLVPKLRKKVLSKTKESEARRASLAAVEGSKIEPPVKLATPAAIHRRPSDSEAIVKKKLITTKITTSGAIAEVTPKPKIVKVKRSYNKQPSENDNKTRHLATTHSETIPIDASNSNKNKILIEAPLSPTPEANKSIQGDKNKDVTMPNDEMPTQMPMAGDTFGRRSDRILPTPSLVINEATKSPSTSPLSSSLTRKTIESTSINDTIDRATNNRTAATKKLESHEFEKTGAAMLTNVKTPLVSSTLASEANGTKQTLNATEDLLQLLQQEAVIVKPSVTTTHNELKKFDERCQKQGTHQKSQGNDDNETKGIARPSKSEASIEKIIEPLDNIIHQQQQVVQKTEVNIAKSNDADGNVKASTIASLKEPSISIDTAKTKTTTTAPAPVNNNSSVDAEHATLAVTKSQQQQEQTTPSPSPTISGEAATKTNSAPQISISRQEDTTGDTTPTTATVEATLPSSEPINNKLVTQVETTTKMPELQLTPAPVQTAQIPHEPGEQPKNKVVVKKLIRQTSIEKAKKTEGLKNKKPEQELQASTETNSTAATAAAITEQSQDKPEVDIKAEVSQKKDEEAATASASEECSETTEISEESSSQSEAAAAALPAKPKKVRKIKKKVIIKRQKRRLSISDSFFNNTSTTDDALPAEVETLEKPIAYVSDDEDDKHDDDAAEEVVEEKKPLKSCINKKVYNIGDEVLYAERFKRTQIRWKRGRVKEQITSISYLIDIDGTDVSSHINYLKKYTGRKVNFGGKEYLEIDYEQLAEEEERAERVQRRSYSIWNMV